MATADSSARHHNPADDDEQKRNAETDGNDENYKQREAVRDRWTETNGKRPVQQVGATEMVKVVQLVS